MANPKGMDELNQRMNPGTYDMPTPGFEPEINPLTGQELNDPTGRMMGNTVTNPQGSTLPGNESYGKNIFIEQGVTGLTRFGGFVYEEWLKELQGRRGAQTYREMRDNDAIIGAILYAIEMLIRKVKWRVEAAGTTTEDISATQFLESCLDDMSISWSDTISEILTFISYGWCFTELCYKKRMGQNQTSSIMRSKYNDGRIGWRKWGIRAQETLWRWRFEFDGSICGMEQIAPPDYKLRYIPIEKALLFRTRSNKNSPEGRSILRNSYRSWYFLKNMQEIEAIGAEKDLTGFPVMWIPPEIFSRETAESSQSYSMWKKIITNMKRDEQEGLLMPLVYDENGNKMYDITMLSCGGNKRQFDTDKIITRYEQRIAMSVLADFIMLGSEKFGSYALSNNKTTLFQSAITTILQNICDVINTYAIPRLFKLNTFDNLTDYPKLTHEEIEKENLEELSNFISRTAQAGAVTYLGDNTLENYIRGKANFPNRADYQDTPKIPLSNNDGYSDNNISNTDELLSSQDQ